MQNAFQKYPLFILVAIATLLNLNTLFNDYALDDIVVFTENRYVLKGIKGIPDIFSNDLMKGYSEKKNLLDQPRYRPLAVAVNAVEYQFFGANPVISHLLNLLLLLGVVILLFTLFSKVIFTDDTMAAFISTLLFAIHPIHTEVVANIKSRDELLTTIFLLLSLKFFLHVKERPRKNWLFAMLFFFLALMTRESAVAFLAIFPLFDYFFLRKSLKASFQSLFRFVPVFAAFMSLRYAVNGNTHPVVTDVLNAPYLLASPAEAFATKFYVLLRYLLLLVFPFPLSSDYSFKEIPYIGLANLRFLISAVVYVVLIYLGIKGIKNRSKLSFAILFFFVTISLVSNLVIDIGTPLSERLLFQPSIPFVLVLGMLFSFLIRRSRTGAITLLVIIVGLMSYKTIARNAEWKNNETLYIADAEHAPNSARTTLFALEIYRAKAMMVQDTIERNRLFDKAIKYGWHSLEVYPNFSITLLNVGFVHYYRAEFDSAAYYWKKGYEADPTDTEAVKCLNVLSDVFYKRANGYLDRGNLHQALLDYEKSVSLNSGNTEAWYNLGGIYFNLHDTLKANFAWQRVKELEPDHHFSSDEFNILN